MNRFHSSVFATQVYILLAQSTWWIGSLFAVAVRLRFLAGLAGIVDVDVILNSSLSVLREVDFQVRTIAMVVTFDDHKTNQIVGTVRLKSGKIPPFRQRLHKEMPVLACPRTLEEGSATFSVLVG